MHYFSRKINFDFRPHVLWIQTLTVDKNGAPNTIFTSTSEMFDFFSVAVLPKQEHVDILKKHAFEFVVGGTVTWKYNADEANVSVRYNFHTRTMQGTSTGIAVALLPHHVIYF
jgi:hypothetical protein